MRIEHANVISALSPHVDWDLLNQQRQTVAALTFPPECKRLTAEQEEAVSGVVNLLDWLTDLTGTGESIAARRDAIRPRALSACAPLARTRSVLAGY